MKFRGTYVLIAWIPAFYLSVYASWFAARYTLGYWPRPNWDDPKQIEGFWMGTYDLSIIILVFGVPVGILFALVSLMRTPAAEGLGRYRLPEWGLGLLLALNAVAILAKVVLDRSRIEHNEWQSLLSGLAWVGIGVAILLSAVLMSRRYLHPLESDINARTQRLTELSAGFLMIVGGSFVMLADLVWNPLRVLEWWWD